MTRTLLVTMCAMTLFFVAAEPAPAQFYKGKTITIIVNYPAGGPTDVEARIVAQHLPRIFPATRPSSSGMSAAPAA